MAAYLALLSDTQGRVAPTPRIFRDRTRILDTLDGTKLIQRYRLPRQAIFELLEVLQPYLTTETQRSHALSPETKLLVTLRFYGKGGFYTEIGDLHGVSPPSVSRCIDATTEAIKNTLNLIKFPRNQEERQQTKEGFYKICGFPRVLGCVDGTLVSIIRPPADEEAAYVCRKGYHAINIQAVTDSNLRFTNLVCKWPGSAHDSFVMQHSSIAEEMERCDSGWLLGDSGYACRPWLLTPLGNPASASEERYNTSHIKTRASVERAFGLLKSRFRCLHKTTGCLPFKPSKAHKIVFVVCQLHNFCIDHRLAPPPPVEDEEDLLFPYQGPVNDGFAVRRALIANTFS